MIWTAKVTSKGQITLPKGLRERLGLRPGDRVTFVEQEGKITIEPFSDDILIWYGALRTDGPPADLKKVRETVRQAIAEEVVREGQNHRR
ncbi:MAG TPA: AbrB/MazE/SpoVT family DNA-binding domain-containing protein [Thermoflexia bacterium]|jgi:AbrB family looped-hinge helix DNA binding protein|nr:AbrB/MazE/SpoVT family DNA-binding domain-containing protein [Thermoflexia bacterium]